MPHVKEEMLVDITPPSPTFPSVPRTPNARALSLPSLPPALLELIVTALAPKDVYSLRQVSRDCFRAFASPGICEFLLKHHFPFAERAPNTHAYDVFNSLLLQRRRLRAGTFTQYLDVFYPSPEEQQERIYPGFHEFDADLGILLTVESTEAINQVDITVRSLSDNGRSIIIPAPLRLEGEPPAIVLSRDRVFLVYPRMNGGSLALILDGKHDGRTLWSGLLSTPVYTAQKLLRPVFNDFYLAFITQLNDRGVIAITHLANNDLESDTVTCRIPFHPENVHSLQCDRNGRILMIGEVFPEVDNLHRVVIINPKTGDAIRQYQLPMSPNFNLAPRDWGYKLSPEGHKLLVWQSPRSAAYRSHLALQVSIFQLPKHHDDISDPPQTVRYLLASPHSELPTRHLNYDFALGVASFGNCLLTYQPLNLDDPIAGYGETLNRHNSILAGCSILAESETVVLGKHWLYMRSRAANDSVKIQLLRHSTPPPMMTESMPASGWSTPLSMVGAGERQFVDAGELTRRLAAMQAGNKESRNYSVSDDFEEMTREHSWKQLSSLGHRLSGKIKRAKSDAVPSLGSRSSKGKEREPMLQEVEGEKVPEKRSRGWSMQAGLAGLAGVAPGEGWKKKLFGKHH
ncbi:hypothetical protein FPQ18DRAFT_359269 [Pyronema domesticum]|nr:hypothetical protein FPQ18DRAFT_359269 [Pyronema domesticum]